MSFANGQVTMTFKCSARAPRDGGLQGPHARPFPAQRLVDLRVIDDDPRRAGPDVGHLGEPPAVALDHERAARRRRCMTHFEPWGAASSMGWASRRVASHATTADPAPVWA
jgi:hypothetical protein